MSQARANASMAFLKWARSSAFANLLHRPDRLRAARTSTGDRRRRRACRLSSADRRLPEKSWSVLPQTYGAVADGQPVLAHAASGESPGKSADESVDFRSPSVSMIRSLLLSRHTPSRTNTHECAFPAPAPRTHPLGAHIYEAPVRQIPAL